MVRVERDYKFLILGFNLYPNDILYQLIIYIYLCAITTSSFLIFWEKIIKFEIFLFLLSVFVIIDKSFLRIKNINTYWLYIYTSTIDIV